MLVLTCTGNEKHLICIFPLNLGLREEIVVSVSNSYNKHILLFFKIFTKTACEPSWPLCFSYPFFHLRKMHISVNDNFLGNFIHCQIYFLSCSFCGVLNFIGETAFSIPPWLGNPFDANLVDTKLLGFLCFAAAIMNVVNLWMILK